MLPIYVDHREVYIQKGGSNCNDEILCLYIFGFLLYTAIEVMFFGGIFFNSQAFFVFSSSGSFFTFL